MNRNPLLHLIWHLVLLHIYISTPTLGCYYLNRRRLPLDLLHVCPSAVKCPWPWTNEEVFDGRGRRRRWMAHGLCWLCNCHVWLRCENHSGARSTLDVLFKLRVATGGVLAIPFFFFFSYTRGRSITTIYFEFMICRNSLYLSPCSMGQIKLKAPYMSSAQIFFLLEQAANGISVSDRCTLTQASHPTYSSSTCSTAGQIWQKNAWQKAQMINAQTHLHQHGVALLHQWLTHTDTPNLSRSGSKF